MKDFVDKLPGMKRAELEKCLICGRGVAACRSPAFYRITIERFFLDGRAIQRRAGLEDFFGGGNGGAALAQVMGDDEDLAKRLALERGIVCDDCAIRSDAPVAGLAERMYSRNEDRFETGTPS